MSKMTLLDIVQTILNDISGDEVNSINDTVESEQVATIVRDTFNNMMSNRKWEHTKQLIVFNNSLDTSKPTHMSFNEDIKEISFVNYNKARQSDGNRIKYAPVHWKDPDAFLRMINNRNSEASNTITVVDNTGINLLITNDRPPEYYTSFDETHIIFDSYDSAVDDTIQSSKIQSMGYVLPVFIVDDDYIPDLPTEAFPYLVEESKSRASIKLRQVEDPTSAVEATKQARWLSRKQRVFESQGRESFYPRYGRRGKK